MSGPARYRCRSCAEILTAMARPAAVLGKLDDWTYIDSQGRASVDRRPQALIDDPRQWWADLAAKDIHTYSSLKCRLELCQWSWFHLHIPGESLDPPALAVPFCHDQPMYYGAAGWYCRATRELPCAYLPRRRSLPVRW